jgi:tRNA-dihydrouridine synthase B
MADAARYNIDRGAQIIDINMGCPAKKVCNKWAGSALMQDEPLALRIVEAVVAACAPRGVPVTLKMRTGWCAAERNALAHGARGRERRRRDGHGARPHARAGLRRPRRVRHRGRGEGGAAIPVVANGDIDSAAEGARGAARHRRRRADDRPRGAGPALDLPRDRALPGHRRCRAAAGARVQRWLLEHLHDHYALYGEHTGVRSARKHIGWAVRALPGGEAFRAAMNTLDDAVRRCARVQHLLRRAGRAHPLPAATTRCGRRTTAGPTRPQRA